MLLSCYFQTWVWLFKSPSVEKPPILLECRQHADHHETAVQSDPLFGAACSGKCYQNIAHHQAISREYKKGLQQVLLENYVQLDIVIDILSTRLD